MNKQEQAAQAQAYQQQQAVAAQAEAAPPQPPPPPPPPAPAPSDGGDLIAKLSELAKLKEAGVLTDDEFAAAKAKLLAG